MIQALHTMLGEGSMSAIKEVSFLYRSHSSDNILGGEMINAWTKTHRGKFRHVDVLLNKPEGKDYAGEMGFIDRAKIEKYLPPVSKADNVIIFVCEF